MKKVLLLGLLLASCSSPLEPTQVQPDQTMNVDISGDFKKDQLSMTIERNENGGQIYTLKANDATVTAHGDNMTGYFSLVDLDETDDIKEIAVGNYGPSSDYSTDFYYYDGKTILPMGTIFGLPEEMTFDHQGALVTEMRGTILHTWFYADVYKLNEQHQLVHEEQDLYEMNTAVTLKVPLTLQKSSTDSSTVFTLEVGDSATIVSCDDETWCLLQNKAGDEGWFAVEDYDHIVGTGLTSGDVFEGLNFAD